MWGRGQREDSATCSALCRLSITSLTTHKQIGPFWCWFPGGWVCVHSRTLWISPMSSPVRLGVSPTTTTSTEFYSQRFWGFFFPPRWNSGLCGLSHSPVVPLGLSIHTWYCLVHQPPPPSIDQLPPPPPWSSSHCLDASPLYPGCPSPPLLLVWMNQSVSSLTPWLLDFHTVKFSGSSGYFLFLICCPSFRCARRQSVSTYASFWPEVPFFFLLMRTFKIYSTSYFQICSAVLLTIVTMLYTISPWLIHLLT